jgi:hypothetical protein
MNEQRTQIWSSGGGVQSTAIAALIVTGQLPKPDLAVIADTGRERSTTWEYLEQWVMPALESVGVVLHRVSKERYATKDLYGGEKGDTLLVPAFTDQGGEIGKLPTYCSNEWKRDVVRRWAVKEHGVKHAVSWIGYSTDELGRAGKTLDASHKTNKWKVRYPLIELRMNRGDCVALVKRLGWGDPPRSSCWMCPNHHMAEWREIREHQLDWQKVVQFEHEIQKIDPHAWLTDQAVPITQADFDDSQEVLFGRERGGCDSGMCFL